MLLAWFPVTRCIRNTEILLCLVYEFLPQSCLELLTLPVLHIGFLDILLLLYLFLRSELSLLVSAFWISQNSPEARSCSEIPYQRPHLLQWASSRSSRPSGLPGIYSLYSRSPWLKQNTCSECLEFKFKREYLNIGHFFAWVAGAAFSFVPSSAFFLWAFTLSLFSFR